MYSVCGAGIFFFFNDTATTEIYTLSLHDALPIFVVASLAARREEVVVDLAAAGDDALHLPGLEGIDLRDHRLERAFGKLLDRSEEHTSELQSRQYLVCRLLLEKKKNTLRQLAHLL